MSDRTSPHDPTGAIRTPAPDAAAAVSDDEIQEALILLHQLSNEAVGSIHALMDQLQIRFSEAALRAGIVSRRELDEALDWIRQRGLTQRGSLVEEVMRRRTGERKVALRKGEPLHPGRQLIIAHVADDPCHPRSELLRRLRQELLARTAGHSGAAIFALLSPCAREGRSQLAAELAISFAQLSCRTLLVDADLRRPSQHELFGASNEVGLAQALAADGTLNLHPVHGLPKLAVLTSGGQPPNPVELLHGPRFARMLADWRRTFEYVVLDTPPTSEFSDGLTVAAAAGNVIVLGKARSTTFSALKEMRRHLEPVHARVVGAVINTF